MTEHAAERPRFAIVMRGYDRDQVDAYLAEYERWAGDAQTHIEAGEARLAAASRRVHSLESKVSDLEERSGDSLPPSVRSLGERAEQILREAWDAAQELRGNIVSEAEEEKEKAQQASGELVAAAEAEAAEIAEASRRQREEAGKEVDEARGKVAHFVKEAEDSAEARAKAVWEEAQAQLAGAHKELDRLEEQRRGTLGELARLRELLEGVIGGGNGPRGPGEGAPVSTREESSSRPAPGKADRGAATDDTRKVGRPDETQPIERLPDDTAENPGLPRSSPGESRSTTARSA